MNHVFYKKGFTLIEMLVVLAIFILIGFAAVTLQVDVFQKNRQFSESLTSVQEARSALKKMVSEIRIANSANTGAYPIAVATPTQFSFYADTDNNNIYDRIRYFYSNGSLMRGVIVPTGSPLTYNPANETTSTLTHNVTNSGTGIFFYHNDLYTGTEVPLASPFNTSDIRVVRIVLSVDASTSTPPGPITEESAVFIRTFKTGS
jgi:prepilin-type N-terminal cleavage/methylation domain-containing protein